MVALARPGNSRRHLGGRGATIIHGDAYDVLPTLAPASADLILTSPPYWGHRTYGQDHNWDILQDWVRSGARKTDVAPYDWYRAHGGVLGLEPYPEWYVEHLAELLERAWPCLKAAGSLWLNLGDTYFARWSSIRPSGRQGLGTSERVRRRTPMGGYRQEKQLLMIPARVAIRLQANRWILRNDLIWHKPNVPPRPESDRLRLTHEHFFHFVKRPTTGRAKYYYDVAAAEDGAQDVVRVNVRAGSDGHSATFPDELIRPRILTSSPPNGVVLDPFCGTGRTLTAALQAGRVGLGIEMSADYVVSARRAVAEFGSCHGREEEA